MNEGKLAVYKHPIIMHSETVACVYFNRVMKSVGYGPYHDWYIVNVMIVFNFKYTTNGEHLDCDR